jgi:hypothetical protein
MSIQDGMPHNSCGPGCSCRATNKEEYARLRELEGKFQMRVHAVERLTEENAKLRNTLNSACGCNKRIGEENEKLRAVADAARRVDHEPVLDRAGMVRAEFIETLAGLNGAFAALDAVILSESDAITFQEALNNPPEPNQKLRAAMPKKRGSVT